MNNRLMILVCCVIVMISGCKKEAGSGGGTHTHADGTVHSNDHKHEEPSEHKHADGTVHKHGDEEKGGKKKMIELNSMIKKNLSIQFTKSLLRKIESTKRIPGEFELRPESRHEYHATLPGHVKLLVNQLDRVKAGDVIARIDSPEWVKLRHEAVEAEGNIRLAEAAIEVKKAMLEETQKQVAFYKERIDTLNKSGTRKIELESAYALAMNQLPRLKAELSAKHVELDEAKEHFESQLAILSSIVGLDVKQLTAKNGDGLPVWRSKLLIEVKASRGGIVDQVKVTHGSWVEVGGHLVTVTDPNMLRFHAHGAQSDIAMYETGQKGLIVPPTGGSLSGKAGIAGEIKVGFKAHPEERKFPVYMNVNGGENWAKAGLSAFLEVVVGGSEQAGIAIPKSAIVKDGLNYVVFVREGHGDHDHAMMRYVELGQSDGRWVEIVKGVKAGEEVVSEGAYALLLAMGNQKQAPAGYHFHADGSLHKEHN